tara:strand:+ start:435 stop:893 length:459 start_codon:yes stop_codon:yes gene_type:complete
MSNNKIKIYKFFRLEDKLDRRFETDIAEGKHFKDIIKDIIDPSKSYLDLSTFYQPLHNIFHLLVNNELWFADANTFNDITETEFTADVEAYKILYPNATISEEYISTAKTDTDEWEYINVGLSKYGTQWGGVLFYEKYCFSYVVGNLLWKQP